MEGIAVVIGGSHHNTLGVIRSLGKEKIKPYVILIDKAKKRSYVSYSKYVNNYWQVNDSEEALSTLLERFVDNNSNPIVVFACNDDIALRLDENKNILPNHFIIPRTIGRLGLNKLMNKRVMANVAQSVGISVPKEFSISCDSIDFPIIAKPFMSVKGNKTDIVVISNQEELNIYLKTHDAENTQFQQFIDKEVEFQIIGLSLKGGEKVIIPGVSTIVGFCKSSNTAYLKYGSLDKRHEVEKCREFMRAVQFNGLFSMEFVRGKDGVNYFMETNFRNDGNAIAVTYAGVNLPVIWYLYSVNSTFDNMSLSINGNQYIMPELQEFFLLKTRQIKLRVFLSHLIKANHFMEFSWDDQKPFWKLLRK